MVVRGRVELPTFRFQFSSWTRCRARLPRTLAADGLSSCVGRSAVKPIGVAPRDGAVYPARPVLRIIRFAAGCVPGWRAGRVALRKWRAPAARIAEPHQPGLWFPGRIRDGAGCRLRCAGLRSGERFLEHASNSRWHRRRVRSDGRHRRVSGGRRRIAICCGPARGRLLPARAC